MEELKNINITKHAIIRYLSREKEMMVTDASYDVWKNTHQDEIEEVKKELLKLLEKASYITTGTYGVHKKASFYISKDDMLTFIIIDSNLVTVYKVDYGLDLIGNKEMLEVLYNNYKRLIEEEENLQKENREKVLQIEHEEKLLGLVIQESEAELQRLRAKKKEYESKKDTLKSLEQSIAARINTAKEKIVLSKRAI